MMKSKGLILTAALSLMVGAAQAQNERVEKEVISVSSSYSYVEAQGGLQLTSTNAPMSKLMTPTAALSFGHYFTPVVGARLHVNAWQAKSGFKDLEQYYKWKYITPSADLMLNLTNLFCKNNLTHVESGHFLNVILLGGVGLNYAWGNDELRDLNLHATRVPMAWGIKDGESKNRLSHNIRAGLRLETNQMKPLGLSFEVNANSLNDRFNSKVNDADDWQFTAMVGLSYRFGHKIKKNERVKFIYRTVEVVDTFEVEEPEIVKDSVMEPYEVLEHAKMDKAIFFQLAASDADAAQGINNAIREAAELMKTSEDAKITVTGYADKGTGSAASNKKFAKKRADDVARKLVSEYGLDKKRIKVDSKGDTVQPFAENDKNRCVIVSGEGTFLIKKFRQVVVDKTIMKKVKKTKTRLIEVKEPVTK